MYPDYQFAQYSLSTAIDFFAKKTLDHETEVFDKLNSRLFALRVQQGRGASQRVQWKKLWSSQLKISRLKRWFLLEGLRSCCLSAESRFGWPYFSWIEWPRDELKEGMIWSHPLGVW